MMLFSSALALHGGRISLPSTSGLHKPLASLKGWPLAEAHDRPSSRVSMYLWGCILDCPGRISQVHWRQCAHSFRGTDASSPASSCIALLDMGCFLV